MAMPDEAKPLVAPITLERHYLIAGKRVTVQVVFPSHVAKDIGAENVYLCAQKVLLRVESKHTEVRELKLGE